MLTMLYKIFEIMYILQLQHLSIGLVLHSFWQLYGTAQIQT